MSVKVNPVDLIEKSRGRQIKAMGHLPICPYCEFTMKWRWSSVQRGYIDKKQVKGGVTREDGKPIESLNGVFPTHEDQVWKCPHCFHVATFGIPITKKDYEQEIIDRGGQILMPDLFVANKDMYDRLKALGYLD